ncbi:hypothetical protein D3C76_1322820 [compost metagenome]
MKQIQHHLLDFVRIIQTPHIGLGGDQNLPFACQHPELGFHFLDQFIQRRILEGQLGSPVKLGQQEQVLHQLVDPLGFAVHAGEGALELLRLVHGAAEQHLQEAVNGGQGCPQLMGGIGNKTHHLLLGLPLRPEGIIQALQHAVEGIGQLLDFLLALAGGQPFV